MTSSYQLKPILHCEIVNGTSQIWFGWICCALLLINLRGFLNARSHLYTYTHILYIYIYIYISVCVYVRRESGREREKYGRFREIWQDDKNKRKIGKTNAVKGSSNDISFFIRKRTSAFFPFLSLFFPHSSPCVFSSLFYSYISSITEL